MKLKEWLEQGKEKVKNFGVKEWGTLLLVGLCFLIIVIPAQKENETGENEEKTEYPAVTQGASKSYTERMEERVEELLACVENVGKVKVMITVSSTEEKNVLKDGTQETEESAETDSAGGSRSSYSENTESATVFADEEPYLLSEKYPEVVGVVVIAEGSGTGSVDYDILNAVQVLFNIPAHKIKIMKMK